MKLSIWPIIHPETLLSFEGVCEMASGVGQAGPGELITGAITYGHLEK
jgi:hypothetical protein